MRALGWKTCAALLVVGLSAIPQSAAATTITLTPGTGTSSVPLNLSGFPPAPAILLFNTGNVAFTAGTFTGTLQTRVYQVGSLLDFLYLVVDNAASSDDIYRVELPGFKGFSTAVAYDNFPVVVPPAIIPSGADRSADGNTVGFDFLLPKIAPGGRGFWFDVFVDANSFTTGTANIFGTSVTGAQDVASVSTLVPTLVPEPSTLMLLTSGIGFLGAEIRRRVRR